MAKLELNPKELVYLASILGATEFFGLKDPFYGMSRNEIAAAISMAQQQLSERGIMEMDFTGSISVTEKAKSIVYDCAFCNAYVLGEYQKEKTTEQFIVYFKESNMILLRFFGEKIQLDTCSVTDVLDIVSELIEHGQSENDTIAQKEYYRFSYNLVNEAKQLVLHDKREVACEMLLSAGLSGNIAETFLNSFINDSCRSAFVVTDFARNTVEPVLCITDSIRMICMEKEPEYDWIAFETTSKGYLDEVEKLLDKVRCSVC